MSTSQKKDALGKGIRSLLENIDADLKTTTGNLRSENREKSTGTLLVPIDKIDTNPHQPRKIFMKLPSRKLAASIKIHQLIQPLTVSGYTKWKIPADRRGTQAPGL